MRTKTLYLTALFCIYLIISISLVNAAITHNPATETTVGDRTAQIRWATDDNGDSTVYYGTTNNLGLSETNATLGSSHSVPLTGLIPGTLYYYMLASTNTTGQTSTADNNGNYYTFTTRPDTTPPFINVSIPQYHNAQWIGFTGVTEPDAIVQVYVNNQAAIGTPNYNYIVSADSAGIFVLPRVNLPQQTNTISFFIRDSAGNTNSDTYSIEVDTVEPNITLQVSNPDTELNYVLDHLPAVSPSASLSIKGTTSEPVNITYRVNNDTQTLSADSSFEFTITLDEASPNLVSIQFADKASNIVSYQQTITVDSQGPLIVSHNLAELTPTYVQNIVVRGNASKPNVDIIVFVNNKTRSVDTWSTSFRDMIVHYGGLAIGAYDSDYTTKTDKNGEFELEVFLTQDIVSQTSQYDLTQQSDLPSPQPTTAPPGTTTVTGGSQTGAAYGVPSVWENLVRIVAVDEFGRSDEKEGTIQFAKCGIGGDWDIDISRMTPSVITPDHLTRGLAELSFSGELEWQGPGEDEEQSGLGAKKRPVIQSVIVRKYPLSEEVRKKFAIDPDILSGEPVPAIDPVSGRTFYVRIPLNQIDYQQKDWEEMQKKVDREDIEVMVPVEIEINYEYEDNYGKSVRKVQRQCVDARTILDIRIPPEVIPRWLLEDAVKFLDNTLDLITQLLEPLKQATLAIFVTCLLSWVVYFVMTIYEKMSCKASKPDEEPCYSARKKMLQTKLAMHWVCDRVFCPSVPMINKYIQDTGMPKGEGPDKKVVCDSGMATSLDYIRSLEGSPSTSFEESVNAVLECDSGKGTPQQCCGQRYMYDWDSACVGITNELDESKCLLAAESGDAGLASSPACQGEIKSLLRTLSNTNLCTIGKEGESTNNIISTQDAGYCKEKDKDGNEYWHYCNIEQTGQKGTSQLTYSGTQSTECKGYLGTSNGKNVYIVPQGERAAYKDQVPVTVSETGQNVILYRGGPCTSGGQALPNCAIDQSSGMIYSLGAGGIGAEQRSTAAPAYSNCNDKGTDTPTSMQADYHNLQRDYVVNPTRGLITSVRCACLPAVTGYLQLWWNILSQVRQCLETILVTGDGSPGVCRAVLSMYVCDVIFKAIRCFTQRFGQGAGGTADYSGPAGFMKAAASAGRDIQSEITGRYGETGLYNTMFNERKLMTAVCLFAFTGDFDFDIEGLLTGGGAVPIETKAFVFPHDRRFLGSNPLNRGYATWIYHTGFGIAAGSDISYHAYLVCSDTNDCNPSEGFLGGKCDCAGKGEKIYDITYEVGGGFLRAGEMVGPNDGDVYVKVSDYPVRFDKVRLVWDPSGDAKGVEGGKIEEKISQIGDNPPAECKFDLAGAEFRCGIAVGDIGYAAFTRPPQLSQSEPYKIGDTIQASADIDKRSPGYDPNDPAKSNPSNQIPFFLQYALLDGGKPIDKGIISIIADGSRSYSVPTNGFKVTESTIMGYFTGGTYTILSDMKITGLTNIPAKITKYDSPKALTDFYVKFTNTVSAADSSDIIKSKISVCEGSIEQTASGREFRNPKCSSAGVGVDSTLISSDKNKLYMQYKGIEIKEISLASIKKDTGFIVDFKQAETAQTKSCNDMWPSDDPKKLSLSIRLFRCSRIDPTKPYSSANCGPEPGELVTYYNQPQEYDVPVEVVCSEKGTTPICPNDQLATTDCKCGDATANAGKQFCHTDWETQKRSVYEYKACILDKKVPESGSSYTEILEGAAGSQIKKDYCGCKSDGSVEDCTNRICNLQQGVYACRA